MTQRLLFLCAHIPPAKVFADIGCDHGYCTQYALEHGLCERAYFSDVSAESLKKAKTLLAKEVHDGRAFPVCADGLEGLGEEADCVLCAGLGGQEIVHIFRGRRLPERFVIQPMKNTEAVRRFLIAQGARLTTDVLFAADGRFYDLLAGTGTGGDRYSEFEYRYGRDNLLSPGRDFSAMVRREIGRLRGALRSVRAQAKRENLLARLAELEGIYDAIEESL